MTVSLERFSDLVSSIYEAALEPERREPALRAVVGALGGAGGALMVAEPRSRRFWNTAFGIDAPEIESYDAYYGGLDPVPAVLERAPVGAVLGMREVCDPAAMRRSEFYAGWAGPIGSGDGMVVSLLRGQRGMSWLACSAPLRKEPFATAARLRLMRLLVPHLQQALRTQIELGEAAHLRDRTLDAFEHVRQGMAWVTADTRLVHANTVASAIFRDGSGMGLQADGRLRLGVAAEEAALQRLVGCAARGGDDGVREGGSLAVSRFGGGRPYAVHVLPLSSAAQGQAGLEALVLLVIVDLDERPTPGPELIRQFFGLTRAEAAVAIATLHSDSLQSVADAMSVTLSTVRTHLQRVYDKTGVRRQADLVRLIHLIDAGLRRRAGEDRER